MSWCEAVLVKTLKTFAKKGLPCTVLLHGDMGAGKTTLVGSLVKKIAGEGQVTSSPTFNIINQYAPNIFHADLYRIKDAAELQNTDFYEILYGDNIFFIEWPFNNVDREIYKKCKNVMNIHIEVKSNGKRKYFVG